MKLRNKKTGETIDVVVNPTDFNTIRLCRVYTVKSLQAVNTWEYNSLAEFNEEWEDYKEPEEYWFVAGRGVVEHALATGDENDPFDKGRREIGNYFSSQEEAELAARKLRTFKELKDKGFKIELWDYDGGNYQERIRTGRILFRVKDYEEVKELLDTVFGGEE